MGSTLFVIVVYTFRNGGILFVIGCILLGYTFLNRIGTFRNRGYTFCNRVDTFRNRGYTFRNRGALNRRVMRVYIRTTWWYTVLV